MASAVLTFSVWSFPIFFSFKTEIFMWGCFTLISFCTLDRVKVWFSLHFFFSIKDTLLLSLFCIHFVSSSQLKCTVRLVFKGYALKEIVSLLQAEVICLHSAEIWQRGFNRVWALQVSLSGINAAAGEQKAEGKCAASLMVTRVPL